MILSTTGPFKDQQIYSKESLFGFAMFFLPPPRQKIKQNFF